MSLCLANTLWLISAPKKSYSTITSSLPTCERNVLKIVTGDPDIILLGLVLEFNDLAAREASNLLLALLADEMLDVEHGTVLDSDGDGGEMLVADLHVIAIAL